MSTDTIRTAALVGHASSGKTTLAEALLHQSGAIATTGSVERGNNRLRLRPAGEAATPFPVFRRRPLRARRHARALDRHARLSGLSRSVDEQSGSGRDCGDRGQRTGRYRVAHHAHDELGRQARAVPHDRDQQDRCRQHRPARSGAHTAGRIRQGVPADQLAGRRRVRKSSIASSIPEENPISLRWPMHTAPWWTKSWKWTRTSWPCTSTRATSRRSSCTTRLKKRCEKDIWCRSALHPRARAQACANC